MKKGVIVASFGTSHEDTRKKTIDVIENDIREKVVEKLKKIKKQPYKKEAYKKDLQYLIFIYILLLI